MYSASDLRKGLKIEIDGIPYVITEFSFAKPGKGHAIYSCKVKNLVNGTTMTKQYRPSAKIDRPEIEEKTLVYSYQEGDNYVFMDEAYEQFLLSANILGDRRHFLVEDLKVEVMFHNGSAIDVKMPATVEKQIIKTEPGFRGNTATNVLKSAILEGGYETQVPLFINEGDIVKVDTETGEYMDRVKKK
ncbi:elongation factor P [Verrucomicrobiota bacterium]